jgi:hypothetical protein
VERALAFAATVIVVDDACPQRSADAVEERFGSSDRVVVIRRAENGGVGAATKTGIERALELGADVIVKIDADDQMDASRIPEMEEVLGAHPDVALVKGNRFTDASVLEIMPKARFVGNAVLSILAKFASGYWSLLDPTNGFLAFNARILRTLNWRAFADSYFFELSVLCSLGLRREKLAEVEMTAIYSTAPSSLSIRRVIMTFPPLLAQAFVRRILMQYLLLDFNVGSLCLLVGAVLTTAGVIFGSQQWYFSIASGIARPTGDIMIVALTLMFGCQLLFAALLYDVLLTSSVLRAIPREAPASGFGRSGRLPTSTKRAPMSRERVVAFVLPLAVAIGTLGWYAIVASRVYEFVPVAVEYAGTQAGYALRIFSGLPRNTESLILTAAFVFSATAPGYLITGWARVTWTSTVERLVFSVTFGLMFYTIAFLALGSAGLLRPVPLFALTLVCLLGSLAVLLRLRSGRTERKPAAQARAEFVAQVKRSKVDIALAVVLGFFTFMALLSGLNYENRFDASWYHLAEARRWALDGGIVDLLKINRSLTAGLPHYQEVLYAGIIPMFGVAAAKLFAWFNLVLALLAIGVFATRYLKSRTWGLVACAIFASTPIIGFSAGTASNDLPLAAITLLAAYALLRWDESPQELGWVVMAGALAGYATGVKTTGFFTVIVCGVLIAGLALARYRRGGEAAASATRAALAGLGAFGIGAAVFAAPGLIQATVWTRDPLFPLFATVFNSPYNIAYLVAPNWYSEYFHHLPEHIVYLVGLPWYLTFDNNSVIGPVFLVMVPAVVATLLVKHAQQRILVFLAAFCALWAALFNMTPTLWARYAEAIAPFAAILAASPVFVSDRRTVGWGMVRAASVVVLVLMIAMNSPFTTLLQRKALLPGNEGAPNYDWNYLYNGYPPPIGGPAPASKAKTIAYLNEHLSPSVRVYEDAELFPWTLYANPQLYEPSPDPRAWTLFSPNAVWQLKANHIDYVAFYARNLPKLAASGVAAHLHKIWESPLDAPGANPGSAVVLSRFE